MKEDKHTSIKLAAESILRAAKGRDTGSKRVSAGTAKGAVIGGVVSVGLMVGSLLLTTASYGLGLCLLAGALSVVGGAYTGAVLGSRSAPNPVSDSLPEPSGESPLGLECLECSVLQDELNTTRTFRDRVSTSNRSTDKPGALLARR